MNVSSTHARRTARLAALAALAFAAAACDHPDPLAPRTRAAPPPSWLAPSSSTVWSGAFALDELALVGNVFQGTAGGRAINESGIIAGATHGYFDNVPAAVNRATRWTPAGPQLLGTLGTPHSLKHSWAHDVNDAGAIVGMSYSDGPIRGFHWTEAGGMQALQSLPGVPDNVTRAYAINNAGQIVGVATAADGSQHAVLWPDAGSAPIDIGLLGGVFTTATDINESGVVVGMVAGGTTSRAYRWTQGGGAQFIDGFGGDYTEAKAINAGGDIVGISAIPDGTWHAFLWTAAGGMQDLGLPPGAVNARASDISDAGHVVVAAGTIDEAGNWADRAWLWVEGQWIDLHDPARGYTIATGINESLTLAGALLSFSGLGSGAARWQVTLTPVVQSPTFTFTGFFPPVDNPPAINRAKAGSAIPVKFGLGGDHGLDVLAPGFPSSQAIACAAGVEVSPVEQTVTAGGSSLTYDAASGQYVYVWKTEKGWAGTCRRLVVRLVDGTERHADFQFVR